MFKTQKDTDRSFSRKVAKPPSFLSTNFTNYKNSRQGLKGSVKHREKRHAPRYAYLLLPKEEKLFGSPIAFPLIMPSGFSSVGTEESAETIFLQNVVDGRFTVCIFCRNNITAYCKV